MGLLIHLIDDPGVVLVRRYALTLPASANPVLVWDLLKRNPEDVTCQKCSTHAVDPAVFMCFCIALPASVPVPHTWCAQGRRVPMHVNGCTSQQCNRKANMQALLLAKAHLQPVLVVPTSGRLILIARSQSATV